MGKKSKKIIIPKNKDIEEYIEILAEEEKRLKEENENQYKKKLKNMDDVMEYLQSEEPEELEEDEKDELEEEQEQEETPIDVSSKVNNYITRIDNEEKEAKRKEALLAAIDRLRKAEEESKKLDEDEFIEWAKARTAEILKEQNNSKSSNDAVKSKKTVEYDGYEEELKENKTTKKERKYSEIIDDQLLEDIMMLDEEDNFKKKYQFYQKDKEKKKKNADKKAKRVSGTSMKELLSSDEFNDMWNNSQDER